MTAKAKGASALNRDKYLMILKNEGYSAAVTSLHRDMAKVEHDAFEGDLNTEPEKRKLLDAMREFSRELWEISLQKGGVNPESS